MNNRPGGQVTRIKKRLAMLRLMPWKPSMQLVEGLRNLFWHD